MKAVITEYLNDVRASGRSKETVQQYKWHLDRWLTWCGEQNVAGFDQLTKANLRAWAAGIRDDWAPATCRTAVVSVKGFLRWAADNGYCAASLAGSLTTPKRQRRVQRMASVDEVGLLLAQCGNDAVGLRNMAMISLAFDSLLRVSELCRLRLRDLDLARMAVLVSGKGGGQRVVRFSERTGLALAAWLAVRSSSCDALFVGVGGLRPGEQMTRGGVRCIFGKLAARAGVPHLSPHALRRGGAVAMIEAGAPSRVVQLHGGWDNLEMLEWYTQQADAAKVFDRWSPLNGVKKGGEPEG